MEAELAGRFHRNVVRETADKPTTMDKQWRKDQQGAKLVRFQNPTPRKINEVPVKQTNPSAAQAGKKRTMYEKARQGRKECRGANQSGAPAME